jgi:hypothetical protein
VLRFLFDHAEIFSMVEILQKLTMVLTESSLQISLDHRSNNYLLFMNNMPNFDSDEETAIIGNEEYHL